MKKVSGCSHHKDILHRNEFLFWLIQYLMLLGVSNWYTEGSIISKQYIYWRSAWLLYVMLSSLLTVHKSNVFTFNYLTIGCVCEEIVCIL